MEKLIAKVNMLSTKQIVEAAQMIGGCQVDQDQRMVRATLIEVYEQREGEAAADELMNRLGM